MTIEDAIREASYDLTRPEYIDTADAAKMMRPALRDAFPGVKFSVRTLPANGRLCMEAR